jgi:hypothetical protein
MKRIVYLFAGITFILVSTIRCEKESFGTEEDGVFLKGGKVKIEKIKAPSEITNKITGRTWMDRNLGASQVATSSTDAAAYGDLYQWGRGGTDGHQLRASDSTSWWSDSDQPRDGKFILGTWWGDRRRPQNNNLWQGVNGINNPCPQGYRIPTRSEWVEEYFSWSTRNVAGGF